MKQLLRISQALEYYTKIGYRYIEVPWIVSESTIKMTFSGPNYWIGDKCLVGSAEQSFLELMDTLENARYVTWSPCFRPDKLDFWHQRYFLKVELIAVHEICVQEMMEDARAFFNRFLKTDIVKTDDGYDLYSGGVELGSYGYRHNKAVGGWTYGTGLAEPRCSKLEIIRPGR